MLEQPNTPDYFLSNADVFVDLNDCSTLKQVVDAMMPYAYQNMIVRAEGNVGYHENTKFRDLVGTPSVSNYVKVVARVWDKGYIDGGNNYVCNTIMLIANAYYTGHINFGFITCDNAGGYWWSGWK